jgi:hypothetical protein
MAPKGFHQLPTVDVHKHATNLLRVSGKHAHTDKQIDLYISQLFYSDICILPLVSLHYYWQ